MDLDLIIRGADVITMDPVLGRIAAAEVGVRNGLIEYVKGSSEAGETGAGETGSRGTGSRETGAAVVLDGRGKVLIPGFVNTHCHAAMTLLRGYADDMTLMPWLEDKIWPAEARLTGEDVYWGTLLACVEMLKAGVTCFADMYFFMDEAAEACAHAGIRASLSVGMIGMGPDGGVAPEAGKKLAAAVDFHRRWHGREDGRITVMLGPHAPYTCPPPFMRDVIEAAAGADIPIHIHLSETEGEVRRCREAHGRSPIRLMMDLGLFQRQVLAAHCVHVDAADRSILAAMRGGVAHNPLSNLKLGSGIAPVAAMLAAGVPVGLGTDGAASTNALGMFEQMRTAALLQKVQSGDPTILPAGQALELATAGGARVLGLGDGIGSIAPGKRADLVLVDLGHPRLTPRHDLVSLLAYSGQDGDVHSVVVDGRLVVRAGRVVTVDEERVRDQVETRAKRLVAGVEK